VKKRESGGERFGKLMGINAPGSQNVVVVKLLRAIFLAHSRSRSNFLLMLWPSTKIAIALASVKANRAIQLINL
jgi:hypothetical protein